MTFNQCFKIRNLILVAAVTTSLGLGTDAIAQDHHSFRIDLNSRTVTNLGSLSSDYGANAMSINDAGQVVGYSQVDGVGGGAEHAFITGPDGMGMRDLGTLGGSWSYANSINEAGQVVGQSSTVKGEYHAFITGPDGRGIKDLGALGKNGNAKANTSIISYSRSAGRRVAQSVGFDETRQRGGNKPARSLR